MQTEAINEKKDLVGQLLKLHMVHNHTTSVRVLPQSMEEHRMRTEQEFEQQKTAFCVHTGTYIANLTGMVDLRK